MKEELKEYGLYIKQSDAKDREPIDFEIRDNNGLYATVWGSHPTDDIDIECNHDFVEYDDDETVGECPLCGATCFWHRENDGEGHQERVPHEWFTPEKIGGIIGRYLEEIKKNGNISL